MHLLERWMHDWCWRVHHRHSEMESGWGAIHTADTNIVESLFVQIVSRMCDWNGNNPGKCTILTALFESGLTILREATSNIFGMTGYILAVGLVYFYSNLLLSSMYLPCIFIHRALDAAAQRCGHLSRCFMLRVTAFGEIYNFDSA